MNRQNSSYLPTSEELDEYMQRVDKRGQLATANDILVRLATEGYAPAEEQLAKACEIYIVGIEKALED